MNKKLVAVLGASALLVGGSAVASADVPDASGVVHGCYQPTGLNHGQLLVIDDATETCPTGYEPLSWPTEANAASLGRQTVTSTGNAGFTATATCPSGKVVVSGGYEWSGTGSVPSSNFHPLSSFPTTAGDGWTVEYHRTAGTVDVYAVCVNS